MTDLAVNANNSGVAYTAADGAVINIEINNFSSLGISGSLPKYHYYATDNAIPNASNISNVNIVINNFLEQPFPSLGISPRNTPITSGEVYNIPILGNVTSYVHNVGGRLIVVNVTQPENHLLSPGIVVREMYLADDGNYYIKSVGIGNGDFTTVNLLASDFVWQSNANGIGTESLYEDINGTGSTNLPPDAYLYQGSIDEMIDDLLLDIDGDYEVVGDTTTKYTLLSNNTTVTTQEGKTYSAPNIMESFNTAASDLATFISNQAGIGTEWFTQTSTQTIFAMWLGQSIGALLDGEMSADEAIISFARFYGTQRLSGFVSQVVTTKTGALEVLSDIFEKDFGLNTPVTKDAFGNVLTTSGDQYAGAVAQALSSMVVDFATNGFDADKAAKVGLVTLAANDNLAAGEIQIPVNDNGVMMRRVG